VIVSRHHPLLGTFVDIRILDDEIDERIANDLDDRIVAEIARLQSVCNRFDPTSELERWKRGEVEHVSPDLAAILALALKWEKRSLGSFSTNTGHLSNLWKAAETRNELPSDAELADAVALAQSAAYDIVNGQPMGIGDLTGVDLNAIAKGWIVDRASEVAATSHPEIEFIVDAGGDLRYQGHQRLSFGIENPLRPYDNEPPLMTFTSGPCGIATSGGARKGFTVGSTRYSHFLNPESGQSFDHFASITIVAADTAAADVVATICGGLEPHQAIETAENLQCACFIVQNSGEVVLNNLGRDLT